MSLIDDIKRDQRNGTPGPWRIVDCDSLGDRCTYYYQEIWSAETDVLVTTEVTRAHHDGGKANVRRCARVPIMEAALLAAEELAAALESSGNVTERHTRALHALSAYRKATEGEG